MTNSLTDKPGIREFLGTLPYVEREKLGGLVNFGTMEDLLREVAIIAYRLHKKQKMIDAVFVLICQETGYDAAESKRLAEERERLTSRETGEANRYESLLK